ncbi:probably inactive receptor-like protein kinase At2g46850 [Cornus florida]|uniref:probably inactive receptor-like protein kinase At2g46850 n=1 Tax=Cornus florida TaxID=4283 RepID=UPI002899CB63|nr:probably inactive receptor-like protein kinase At2g46850 [Cornus florida]
MSPYRFHLLFGFSIILTLLLQQPISHSLTQYPFQPNQCGEKCGAFQIPYPFHVNTSCGSLSDSFRLSCFNSTSLFLNIASQSYQILQFFTDGMLVDFPNSSSCREYNGLNSFGFQGNDYFGISTENILGLYDCEDSSLCKADCEKTLMHGCDGRAGGYPACCYPLSDRSAWRAGDGFPVFSQFGCRGFSCWVVPQGSITGRRGVKLEWAVPNNSSKATCAANAYIINATSVPSGLRCQCQDGFVGDGFAQGVGCFKSCVREGKDLHGEDCDKRRHSSKKVEILAGVLTSAFTIASLIALFCLLRRPIKSGNFDLDQTHIQSSILFSKASRTRLFTYHELEEATKGFEDAQKLVGGTKGTFYAGILEDGSHVAVHKVHCESERDLVQVLSRVELLSAVLHRSMARLLGCCIDSGYTPLVVYEYPVNGTLEEHLHHNKAQKIGLDWYKRLNIATETASFLAFLQYEISPPIFHHDLRSGCIFLDENFSIKIAGFGLLATSIGDGPLSVNNSDGSPFGRNDVCGLGVVLLEIIAGARQLDLPTIALEKIRNGKLEEIVDPLLYYHEQPRFHREQIEIVADLATRCLLFGGDGKLGMVDVARKLLHITKENVDGGSGREPALKETFSNSSLLQMISMSPDSIHVP